MAREFAKEFYNSTEWQMARRAALMRDNYLCVMCGAPAEEVHHIKHLSPDNIGDVSITMSLDNLESLCKACHFAEHRGDKGRQRMLNEQYPYEFDENGQLVEKKTKFV